jgi:alginate O-acetyltransferase complex protein AlgF
MTKALYIQTREMLDNRQEVSFMRIFQFVLLFALFSLPTLANTSDDGGLYAPPPPADAAYVRAIGAGSMVSLGSSVMAVPSNSISEGGAGTYSLVTQGKYGEGQQALEVKAGRYYSVVSKPTQKLLEDPIASDPAKALLVFYNLTSKPGLSLKTADGKTEIIAATAPASLGSRSVNALKVGFGLADANSVLATTPVQQLERGQAYSLIAQEEEGKLALTLVQNTVALPQ